LVFVRYQPPAILQVQPRVFKERVGVVPTPLR